MQLKVDGYDRTKQRLELEKHGTSILAAKCSIFQSATKWDDFSDEFLGLQNWISQSRNGLRFVWGAVFVGLRDDRL